METLQRVCFAVAMLSLVACGSSGPGMTVPSDADGSADSLDVDIGPENDVPDDTPTILDEGPPDTVQEDAAPKEGELGWPCESNADCLEPYCVETDDGPNTREHTA